MRNGIPSLAPHGNEDARDGGTGRGGTTGDRPDPSTLAGVPEALQYIMDRLEAIEASLAEGSPELLRPTQAERALGYPAGYLAPSRYPWRTPDFGRAGRLHTQAAWSRWNRETSDNARRTEWETLGAVERRRIRGAA